MSLDLIVVIYPLITYAASMSLCISSYVEQGLAIQWSVRRSRLSQKSAKQCTQQTPSSLYLTVRLDGPARYGKLFPYYTEDMYPHGMLAGSGLKEQCLKPSEVERQAQNPLSDSSST